MGSRVVVGGTIGADNPGRRLWKQINTLYSLLKACF